jgi:hypothetical protein
VILSASGHTPEDVAEWVERTGDVAVFGRYFSQSDELQVSMSCIKAKFTKTLTSTGWTPSCQPGLASEGVWRSPYQSLRSTYFLLGWIARVYRPAHLCTGAGATRRSTTVADVPI